MTGVKNELGPTGQAAVHAVAHRREQLGLTYAQLSRRLIRNSRDIAPLALRRIEQGKRRVDVDDLVALAVALEVSPVTLLMPADVDAEDLVTVTGVGNRVPAKRAWSWFNASYPLTGSVMAFYSDALPAWERDDMENQLGTVRR